MAEKYSTLHKIEWSLTFALATTAVCTVVLSPRQWPDAVILMYLAVRLLVFSLLTAAV